MDKLFCSSLGTKLSVEQVVCEIKKFISEDKNRHYKIIIGSDSDGHSSAITDFVTAIVVHRIGNGGRYFWRRIELPKFHTLRDRIIQEVLLSLETAKEVLNFLKSAETENFSAQGGPAFGWDFEIHADIGENGATRTMMQEVLGMIRAYNFEARTKPESFAATTIADRHV